MSTTTGPVTERPATHPDDADAPLERRPPRTLWLVVRRELRTRGRSGAYIFSTLFSMVLLVGAILLPQLLSGPQTYRIGTVGDGNAALLDAAVSLANDDAEDPTTIERTSFASVDAAERAVTDGEVDAALVEGRELVVATAAGFGGSGLERLLQEAAATGQLQELVGEQRADAVVRTLTADTLAVRALTGQETSEQEGRGWIAYGAVFLTYLTILSYAAWALTGVTEEKSSRVIELLLAAARPWQLLAGKLLGIGVLGLGQFVLTATAALVAIRVSGAFDLPAVPTDLLGVLVLWVLLGFGMYLVLAGAAGALASKTEDAQSAMTPISLMTLTAFILSFWVLDDPDGTIALVGTFVPMTAPFIVPVRAAFDALPLWQHALSVALTLATVAGCVALAGRIYAGGVLRFGGRVRVTEAWRDAEL